MENSNITEGVYNKLGEKVFWLFFWENFPLTIIFLAGSIILFVLDMQNFTISFFGGMQKYLPMATLIVFLLFLISCAATYAISRILYSSWAFMLENDSLKIKRGIFNKTEDAIPYKQIQNVDIERSFLFQIMGLSRLVILTAGHEDENSSQDESEGIIPAIDKNVAEALQATLLSKANVQKITNAV